MLTKSKIRDLHNLAQSLKDPADFVQAYRVLVAHHPRTRDRRYKLRTARVAAFQAMSLDERAQFMEKRKAEHAYQQEAKKTTARHKKQDDIKFLADLRTQSLGHGFTPLFFHYHLSYQSENGIQRRLFASSCVLVNKDNEPIAKGISLVSPSDNPSKLEGRIWALQRAIEAELAQDTYYPVSRVEARWITHNFRSSESSAAWSNKAVYTPGNSELTDIEVDRINTRRARADVKQVVT